MNKNESSCSENYFIFCPTCLIKLDKKFLGERCPRCNSVVMPKGCDGCKKMCK